MRIVRDAFAKAAGLVEAGEKPKVEKTKIPNTYRIMYKRSRAYIRKFPGEFRGIGTVWRFYNLNPRISWGKKLGRVETKKLADLVQYFKDAIDEKT